MDDTLVYMTKLFNYYLKYANVENKKKANQTLAIKPNPYGASLKALLLLPLKCIMPYFKRTGH